MILLKPEEGQVVGHRQAGAGRRGRVGTAAVIHRPQPQQRRARLHLRGNGFFLGRHSLVVPLMATGNDTRRTVLFGEIRDGQHDLQASLAAVLGMPPERGGIVTMQWLKALTRADLDRLGDAELNIRLDLDTVATDPDVGRCLQDRPGYPDEQRVQRHLHSRVAAPQDTGDTSCLHACEVRIDTAGRGIQVGVQLFGKGLQRCWRDEVRNDDPTVTPDDLHHLLDRCIAADRREFSCIHLLSTCLVLSLFCPASLGDLAPPTRSNHAVPLLFRWRRPAPPGWRTHHYRTWSFDQVI
ncbi:hypothetical protein D9M71_322220 [compost metagenome]